MQDFVHQPYDFCFSSLRAYDMSMSPRPRRETRLSRRRRGRRRSRRRLIVVAPVAAHCSIVATRHRPGALWVGLSASRRILMRSFGPGTLPVH